jgi:parallel beta-helix repeat protein
MRASALRRIGRFGLLLGLMLAVAAPASAFAVDPPEPTSALVPCSQASDRVQISVSSHLDPSCTYTGGFDIVASDVVFDCQNALVKAPESTGARGIEIITPASVDMANVTVRNCRVEGFLNNIRATRTDFRALTEGHEYDHNLSNITIENSTSTNSRGVGVYVDGYVSDVTLRNLTITGAGSTGIYLEAGSRNNTVEDNVIEDNGFGENGPNGGTKTLGGVTYRFWGVGREGLAIDGSYGNHVSGNTFSGNANGGIFLYTNCGEYVTSNPPRWFQRRFGADNNVIEDNHFTGGLNGVWVGSRMGENIFPMECSDPKYINNGGLQVALDRAAGNAVRDNSFDDVTYGVRVEDDNTTVTGNTFTAPDATHHAIIVGTRFRTDALNHPVRNATVTGNTATIVGNDFPFRWIYGTDNLVAAGNRVGNIPTGVCQGKPLPHTALIFVLALAVDDPDNPPQPPPGLTMPTVGVIPPCVSIVPGGASRVEGASGSATLSIPVTLSAASSDPVTAHWSTYRPAAPTAGYAEPPGDFDEASGTVTFLPGQTTASVPVTVRGDLIDEPDEFVLLQLTDPMNAAVRGGLYGLGLGAIVDDDAPPVVIPGGASVTEGDSSSTVVSIPVTLSAASGKTVTASWSTYRLLGTAGFAAPPGDFDEASGVVTFLPGQTSATVSITIRGDVVDEPDELVLIPFTSAVNATVGGFYHLGIGLITDDDPA